MLTARPATRKAERRRMACLGAGALAGAAILAAWFAPRDMAPWAALAALCATLLLLPVILRGPRGTPVLTYHSVSPDASWLPWADRISIRPESLDRHLRLFRRMGYEIVRTEDWVADRKGGIAPGDRTLMLHFDDGYLDNRLHAWPILRAHGATATMFVSTDFVDPRDARRDQGPDAGYLTWAELREMEAAPAWRIEAHGTDHGRVVTGPREVGRLTAENIGREAWMQWAAMPGDKHDWYRRAPVVPPGTAIRESRPALAGPAMDETPETYAARVRDTLSTARDRIAREVGRRPQIFCWPQNRTSAEARAIARDLGYAATTGAGHRNTAADRPDEISRLHAGQDYAGFRCGWIDDLALRAHLRCFEGAFAWALPLALIGLLRRVADAVRPLATRSGRSRTKALRP